MQVSGGCHCGRIRFQADIDPARVVVCHCTDCQAFTSSAFRVTVPASMSSFSLTGGPPRTYVKTGDSGAKRVQAFCGDCGMSLYSTALIDPQSVMLRLGAIDQRRSLRPALQVWRRSTVGWLSGLDEIPGSSEQQALDPR